MNKIKLGLLGLVCLSLFAGAAFGQKKKTTVTDSEITGGLKEALSKGVKFAVDNLGKEDGFFKNTRVKIPLPKNLQKVEKGLRVAGQGKAVDEFILSTLLRRMSTR